MSTTAPEAPVWKRHDRGSEEPGSGAGLGPGAAARRGQRAVLRRGRPDRGHRPHHRAGRGGQGVALQPLRQQGGAGGRLPGLPARRTSRPADRRPWPRSTIPARRSWPSSTPRPGRSPSPTSTAVPSSPHPPRHRPADWSSRPPTNSGPGSAAMFTELAEQAGAPDPDGLGRQLHLLYDGAGLAARMDHHDPGIAPATRCGRRGAARFGAGLRGPLLAGHGVSAVRRCRPPPDRAPGGQAPAPSGETAGRDTAPVPTAARSSSST